MPGACGKGGQGCHVWSGGVAGRNICKSRVKEGNEKSGGGRREVLKTMREDGRGVGGKRGETSLCSAAVPMGVRLSRSKQEK